MASLVELYVWNKSSVNFKVLLQFYLLLNAHELS